MRPGRKPGGPKTGGRRKGTPNRKTREQIEQIKASGLTPLDFMLAVMRNPKARLAMRFDAARQAAPYVHPRLTAFEYSGKDGGPVEVKQVSDIEAARLIGRLLQRVSTQTSHNDDYRK
jgi:hypothetical protein